MQEINLNNWEEFEERVKGLERERFEQNLLDKFLYRGQKRCNSYKFETTLERHLQKCISLKEYYHLIFVTKPQIESFTGEKWNILSRDEFDNWLNVYDSIMEHAFGWSVDFQDI